MSRLEYTLYVGWAGCLVQVYIEKQCDGDGDAAIVRRRRKLQQCVTNIRIYSFDKRVEALHISGDDRSGDDGVFSVTFTVTKGARLHTGDDGDDVFRSARTSCTTSVPRTYVCAKNLDQLYSSLNLPARPNSL